MNLLSSRAFHSGNLHRTSSFPDLLMRNLVTMNACTMDQLVTAFFSLSFFPFHSLKLHTRNNEFLLVESRMHHKSQSYTLLYRRVKI